MYTIIIGNKIYTLLNIDNIIDSFSHNIRFNFSLVNNNNGTKHDKLVLNNHVYQYSKMSIQKNIDKYCKTFDISEEYVIKFFNDLNKYNFVKLQSNGPARYNTILQSIGCPYQLTHNLRVGYFTIIDEIIRKCKPVIFGFSIQNKTRDKHLYVKNLNHSKQNQFGTKNAGHNWDIEIKILYWLHNNDFIDATLCFLEDTKVPTLNCEFIKPSVEIITLILQYFNSCILKNYINDSKNKYNVHEQFNKITFDNNDCIIQS